MTKPIAQRLREFEGFRCDLVNELCNDDDRRGCDECFSKMLNAIADEIEREQDETVLRRIRSWANVRNMPMKDGETLDEWLDRWTVMRPRFDNNEPIQEGDPFIQKFSGEEAVLHHVGIALYAEENGPNAVWLPNETVPRPAAKVYGADGVEIKAGDTVYQVDTGREYEVSNPHGRGEVTYDYVDCCGCFLKPDQLTHEKPVFDADNKRIKFRDTVWNERGKKLTVIDIIPDECCVLCNDKLTYMAQHLTHQEPDSLEKLRDDAMKPPRHYYMDLIGHDVGLKDDEEINIAVHTHIINRAIAIVERSA